ncbi:MAG: DUF4129 domain-containing protein [Gemmatimonadaceae bacterium]|nr:DUF4129 domain-containing protein [Gemmatimonadaceae bacterium]
MLSLAHLTASPLLLQGQQWTDQAVRDTIAAIASQSAYTRTLKQSLWDRLFQFLGDQLRALVDAISHTEYGRPVVLVLVAVLVVLVLARVVIGIRAEREVGARRVVGPTAVENQAQLAAAERLAAAGEYTAAAHVLFACVLATGSARGEFRFHPSKTSGDYARDLRRRAAAWLAPFQDFRARYDRVIYGDAVCSAEDYRVLLQKAQQMVVGP